MSTQITQAGEAAKNTPSDVEDNQDTSSDAGDIQNPSTASDRENELLEQLEAAKKRNEELLSESIGRRHSLKEIKEEKQTLEERTQALEERLAALDAEARSSKLEAEKVKALGEFKLPAEAASLLGDDIEKVRENAERMAALVGLNNKGVPSSDKTESNQRLSGGRTPMQPTLPDINELIIANSR